MRTRLRRVRKGRARSEGVAAAASLCRHLRLLTGALAVQVHELPASPRLKRRPKRAVRQSAQQADKVQLLLLATLVAPSGAGAPSLPPSLPLPLPPPLFAGGDAAAAAAAAAARHTLSNGMALVCLFFQSFVLCCAAGR